MMNRSIQFIVCVLAILCQNINSAVAQTRSYDGVISVVPVQLEQRGKSVYINIDFVLEDVKVKSAHGVDFIPATGCSCTYLQSSESIHQGT